MMSINEMSVEAEPTQDHRMDQIARDHSGSLGPASLLKQGHSRANGTVLHPDCS